MKSEGTLCEYTYNSEPKHLIYQASAWWGNIRETQVEGHSTEYLANTPQSCQGLGKLGKTKTVTDERKSKET